MQTSHQILRYILIDFTEGWARVRREKGVAKYKSLAVGGKLKVVIKEQEGNMKTYFYRVPARSLVSVYSEVIHIPCRAYEQHLGNKIEL